jgi:predicted LPLAT superfamily acyltransferase
MSFKPCAIVPSRNHHIAMAGIIHQLRAADLHVFVIDDASDEPARRTLGALHCPDQGVTVHRFDVNQGKGGAVTKGFELATTAGFTHALQVDADGQHDLAALPSLLALGKSNIQAVIVGTPIYDRSAPLGRRIGRWITHLWVCVEILSLRVIDSMCGFRLYPLNAVTSLLREERVGRHMEFDTEILVRLTWRGVPSLTAPVHVTYPVGNSSNFRPIRDNWRITKMHTRLVLTMLTRLPRLLRRRWTKGDASHWSAMSERGAFLGLRFLAGVYRLTGRYGCMAALLPIALYFHLTGVEQRRASHLFLRRAFAALGDVHEPSWIDGLRHSLGFAWKTVETFAGWVGGIDKDGVEIVHRDEMKRLATSGRGIILIVSHLGNIDLTRATLDDDQRAKITLLVHTHHAANYTRLLQRFRPEAAISAVQVSEINPATILALKETTDGGGWVAIAGDRTPIHGTERTSRAAFLGHDAAFPQGPYVLAHLLECPVYLMFCLRENGRYRVYFERFADRIELPRRNKEIALSEWVARYARRLEAYCLRDPFQWYNFFDFWALAPVTKEVRAQ